MFRGMNSEAAVNKMIITGPNSSLLMKVHLKKDFEKCEDLGKRKNKIFSIIFFKISRKKLK